MVLYHWLNKRKLEAAREAELSSRAAWTGYPRSPRRTASGGCSSGVRAVGRRAQALTRLVRQPAPRSQGPSAAAARRQAANVTNALPVVPYSGSTTDSGLRAARPRRSCYSPRTRGSLPRPPARSLPGAASPAPCPCPAADCPGSSALPPARQGRRPRSFPVLHRPDQRRLVHHRPAAGVDEHGIRTHQVRTHCRSASPACACSAARAASRCPTPAAGRPCPPGERSARCSSSAG